MVPLALVLASIAFTWITERAICRGLSLTPLKSVYALIDLLPYGIALLISLGISQQNPLAAAGFLLIHAAVLFGFGLSLCRMAHSKASIPEMKLVLTMGLAATAWRFIGFIVTLVLSITLLPFMAITAILVG